MVAHKSFNSRVDELIVLEGFHCVENRHQRHTRPCLKYISLFNDALVLKVTDTTLTTAHSPDDRFWPNIKNIGVFAVNTIGHFDTFGICYAYRLDI